jgi:hypothetical protein
MRIRNLFDPGSGMENIRIRTTAYSLKDKFSVYVKFQNTAVNVDLCFQGRSGPLFV